MTTDKRIYNRIGNKIINRDINNVVDMVWKVSNKFLEEGIG